MINLFHKLAISLAIPVSALSLHATDLSLAGNWRFELDRADAGKEAGWFNRNLTDSIQLPGVLQSQGFGDEISTKTPWVTSLGGIWWQTQPEELRAPFSQPGKVEVPFLSQPPRHYLGAAWYQREIEVPKEWENRRVELFLERPRWESSIWVNDKPIGSARSLVAPHEYDLGVLEPGRHRLTIRLDNRLIVQDPKGNGHLTSGHAITDAVGSTWNGIVGRIELRSTPQVWFSDVQAFPNVAEKSVKVVFSIGNSTGKPGEGWISAGSEKTKVSWDATGGKAAVVVPLGADAKTWDEYHPHLHKLDVSLESPAGQHTQQVTFGLREITWRGKEPLINGRVVNFRTTNFGLDFPLTGYPAMDVESWRKIILRCKEFGLNGIRFHSACPPEAAFTAADELGFFLQPECGLWVSFYADSPFTQYLEEETPLLLRAYGNHPSFVMFSPGNEPKGDYTKITPKLAKQWYELDPRRLYSAGTGWGHGSQVFGGPQFATLLRFRKGQLRNTTGWFGADFRVAMDEDVQIPVLAHEIGQWCAYPDFSVIDKFTGYMRPSNFRIFRHIAEKSGLLEDNRAISWASGKFQLACYKEELEANLRTPGLAGHQMLDIRDYLGQGTALIGVLDAFWDPKNYVTGEEFRRFHSMTVPLARLMKRTFTTAETLESDVEIYHFGEKPIVGAKPYWKITTADGTTLASGNWETRDIPIGKNISLGRVTLALASLPSPSALKLVVGLEGTSVENDWNFWLYPAETTPSAISDELLVSSDWREASARLAQGGKVLFTPQALDPKLSPQMQKTPVFWNIQMTVRSPKQKPRFDAMLGLLCDPKHPALAEFPTDIHCDWQWTNIIDGVPSINLSTMPRELLPIVSVIDDWNRGWRLGAIFECGVGQGKLLVSAIPLENKDPVTVQLRKSLIGYASGNSFQPSTSLTTAQLDQLFNIDPKAAPRPEERKFDPDLDDGTLNPKKKAPPASQ